MTGKEDKVVVQLSGGGPWGFRLQGGAGTGLPLVVSKVRRKSKAYKNLYEGDIIVSVNGRCCNDLTYDQVMEIADKSGSQLSLEVVRSQNSNKENVAPDVTRSIGKNFSSSQSEKSTVTKELVTFTETQKKVTEESEGLRIKSATLLSDDAITSQNTETESETTSAKTETKTSSEFSDSFSNMFNMPDFTKLQNDESKINFDTSSKTSTQEIITDDNEFQKVATESVHEKAGNTEKMFFKEELEKVTKSEEKMPPSFFDKSTLSGLPLTSTEVENILNSTAIVDNFSSEKTEVIKIEKTEKSSVQTTVSDLYPSSDTTVSTTDIKETVSSTLNDTSQKNETGKKIPPPTLPKPKIRPFSDSCLDRLTFLEEFSGEQSETDSMKQLTNDSFYSSTDSSFASHMTRKKKMFSSSSFYEEPHAIYPTVEEQVEMAKKIADSLADDTNKKSKGANMFFKRVKKSTKWVHEGPEPSDDSAPGTPEIDPEPPTPDPSQVPWKTKKGLPKLKLVLDPRHPLDAVTLRSTGQVISEHNVISPEVCHGLVRDLESPVGKGAALFAKRKKKSEEWIVDEEKVKTLMRAQENKVNQLQDPLNNLKGYTRTSSVIESQRIKLLKTPWEAALESPIGSCDAAFIRVDPGHLAETVIKAADNKRKDSLSPETRMETCQSPPIPITPAAAYYDIYKAKAPKGWIGSTSTQSNFSSSDSFTTHGFYGTSGNEWASSTIQTSSITTSTLPKKMTFQNFNTVPRKWKPLK